MAYSTVASVRARLPLITIEVQSDAQITDYITQADAEINGRLRARYAIPFSTPDSLLKYLSLELACALTLENVYGSAVPEGMEIPIRMRERIKTILDAVAQGSILLTGSEQVGAALPEISNEGLEYRDGGRSEFWVDPEVPQRAGD